MRRFRTVIASALGIVGVAAIITGLLLSYAPRTIFDADSFADLAVASLGNPDVASFTADRLTDAVVSTYRDLTPYRLIVLAAARAIRTTPSSIGWRRTSRTVRGNSGSSSRKRTPL